MQNFTIFGIIVAIIIILYGLRMILRKSDDAAPSLDSPLQFNPDSQLPIIPRHVRDQLQQEAALALGADAAASDEASAEVRSDAFGKNAFGKNAPNKATAAKNSADQVVTQTDASDRAAVKDLTSADQLSSEINLEQSPETNLEKSQVQDSNHQAVADHAAHSEAVASQGIETQSNTTASISTESELEQNVAQNTTADQTTATEQSQLAAQKSTDYQLNPLLEAAEIKDFEQESSLLDKHLHEQQRYDDQSTLANAETIIALNVYPHPRKALSGDKTLKVLLKYGLRFGELSCFHRYEEEEEGGGLMFSVLRIGDEGPNGFDLESLSCEQVQGLAFFLALPHRNVQKGFDTMVSIAGLIAREIDGTVYDENNLEFTPQLKEHWRHKAIDYRRGQ